MAALWAISDVHVGHDENVEILTALPRHAGDWLIVAGDVGERDEHLELAWTLFAERFSRIVWVPGNHELWTLPGEQHRGEARYQHLVALCRRWGVLTPEDDWVAFDTPGRTHLLAPLLVLYDYTFRPPEVPLDGAVAWAAETGILCADEQYLKPDPWPSVPAWCAARVRATEARLSDETRGQRTVLINHYPLRYDLVRLRRIPRFSIWCGTKHTEDWHQRFGADVVVSGHLHVPRTEWRDGVRCEEVSLGYPRERKEPRPAQSYLRRIL